MPDIDHGVGPSRLLRGLATIPTRAAAVTMRPLSGVLDAAAVVGIELQRRAVDRLLESDELQRLVLAVGSSALLRQMAGRALDSDAAKDVVDDFFDSGLLDHLVD